MKNVYEPELELTSYKSLIKYTIITLSVLILVSVSSSLYSFWGLEGTVLKVAELISNIIFIICIISLYPIIMELGYTTINRSRERTNTTIYGKKRKAVIYLCVSGVLFLLSLMVLLYTQSHYKHIEREDAECITAHFEEYFESLGHTSLRYIGFSDHKNLSLIKSCDLLNTIEPGAELTILKSPNSDIAIGIYENDRTILDYDESMKAIDVQRKGWVVILIVFYVIILGSFLLFSARVNTRRDP
ncbi:MAG: hypothetical protein K5857_11000 [Lachnospiraceae bacterium]|nr:hypothetical protein [Lachnospiraceae bacterium]